MFYWREQMGPVHWGFTDRLDGASATPYQSFNLGAHVGDDPVAVQANRGRLAQALGLPPRQLVFMGQRHGREVLTVDGPWDGSEPAQVDGLVTTVPGLALAALVADCTPVLLADPDRKVIGAVHAGRPGLTLGIVDVAVERMREAGARAITAVVGPSVCGRCYEVPADLRDAAAQVAPESATVSWTGTPAVDVAAGVVAQLRANDVAVQWVPGCAREDQRLFSYRRDGQTGRFAGVVALAPR